MSYSNLIKVEKIPEELQKEINKKFDERRKNRKKSRVKPRTPRYDDVYFEGLEYLNKL